MSVSRVVGLGIWVGLGSRMGLTQKGQYPLISEYSLNHMQDPSMI